jgi:hypothetical protein
MVIRHHDDQTMIHRHTSIRWRSAYCSLSDGKSAARSVRRGTIAAPSGTARQLAPLRIHALILSMSVCGRHGSSPTCRRRFRQRRKASKLLSYNLGALAQLGEHLLCKRVSGRETLPAVRSSLGNFARGVNVLRGVRTPSASQLAHLLAQPETASLPVAAGSAPALGARTREPHFVSSA